VLFAILSTDSIFVKESIISKGILDKKYEDVEWTDLEHNSVKRLLPNAVQNLGFLKVRESLRQLTDAVPASQVT